MAGRREDGMLFSDCRVAFVPSETLTPKSIAEIAPIVEKYGGEILEPEPSGKLAVYQATHIISNTIDFEEFEQAELMMVPVVRSEWIQDSLHKRKLAPIRPHSPDPLMIFHAVNVTCADIPMSDRDAIVGATAALGGTESKDLGRLTTHICALSMDHPKCVIAREKKLKCKIVLPHWFDECFKLGRRIDEGPYMLPDPAILKTPAGSDGSDAVGLPSSIHMQGATSAVPDVWPDRQARGSLHVFNQKTVMLSSEQPLAGERFLEVVRGLVVKGGGKLTENVDQCDMFVCQYRDGDEYVRASQAGKDVGNLSWLLYLIAHDQWTSPFRRLLHYPVPRNGIPGFEGLKITISNYGGEARLYLENLIKACGAEYTKTMRQDNTHLITARPNSDKCEAALDWGVSMVNHLWIEESYAKCTLLSIANHPKYTHFPPRTNLSEVIGQTSLDKMILRMLYYPGDEGVEDSDATSSSFGDENCVPGSTDPELAEDEEKQDGKEEPVQRPTRKARKKSPELPALGKANSNKAAFTTPARASRRARTGKENDTPSSERLPSSRGAKDKAMNRLHGLAPDIALYEKEKKRSTKDGNGPWGGKRAAAEMEKQKAAEAAAAAAIKTQKQKGQKRQQSEDGDDEEDAAEESDRPAKRSKPSLPPVLYRICLTGYERWRDQRAKDEDNDRRKLRRMGVHIVQEGQPCDYLAAPRVIRTQKFLVTLARGAEPINCKFFDDALDSGKLPDPSEYALRDDDADVDLRRSVARARQNRGRLLRTVPVYCTTEMEHGAKAFKAIAEANGATFKTYRARSGSTIRPTTAEEDGGAPPDPVYLISGATPAERELWPRFKEMARLGHMEPRIVKGIWLLDVAMQQKLVFDDSHRHVTDEEK